MVRAKVIVRVMLWRILMVRVEVIARVMLWSILMVRVKVIVRVMLWRILMGFMLQLAYCVVQFLEKDSTLTEPVRGTHSPRLLYFS